MTVLLEQILNPLGEFMEIAFVLLAVSLTPDYRPKLVEEISLTIPQYEAIHIEDSDKFLNDLMLSPHWGVTRAPDGNYIANPRSLENLSGKYNAKGISLIPNSSNVFRTKAGWTTQIVFKRPDEYTRIIESGESFMLSIYDSFEKEISINSYSTLAIEISQTPPIYLTLRESGKDRTRNTTLQVLPLLIAQVDSLANLPQTYRTADIYSEFYETYFDSMSADSELKRTDGIQGRDNFYGYFRAQNGTNYNGVNIKITHPVYCPDEGTRRGNRLRKAEYLGVPYFENDFLFYLIEDNTVYLPSEYDERFGFFSGNETFEGTISILNIDQELLLESKGPFTGWQR